MKVYGTQNVYEAALDRVRRVFNDFPTVVVGVSGGKDSTVVLNLALKVAQEMGRLPLPVMFFDQEAEWGMVIDHMRGVMGDPRVKPYWLQVPFRITNATSSADPWLYCWREEDRDKWMRPKEPNSIHENDYGTEDFFPMFKAFLRKHFPDGRACYLSGVRTEESPGRYVGLTSSVVYDEITWGSILDAKRGHYTLYPIYDWCISDVWKAIHSNGWPYCPVYDRMFQYGVPIKKMRVSHLHHETAIATLYYLQEMEPLTWERLAARVGGIKAAGSLTEDGYHCPQRLPPAFDNWRQYRDYLLQHLMRDERTSGILAKTFARMDRMYEGLKDEEGMLRIHIASILATDSEHTLLTQWELQPEQNRHRKWRAHQKRKANDALQPAVPSAD